MKTRLITAFVALPILIAAVLLPKFLPDQTWTTWPFLIIAGLALAAGLFEFYSLSKTLELKADAAVGYMGAAVFFAAFLFDAPSTSPELLLMISAAFLIALLISQTFRFQKDFSKMLTGIGVTMLGVFYVAFLGGFLVSLRAGFESTPDLSSDLLAYFFLVLMGSDAGAYFAGRAFGKHKLAPGISPGKTVEGLIGGIITAGAFGALATAWFLPELKFGWSIGLAAVMAVVGVLGDLTESAMKRGSGAKDAATLLPGHGGLLDRLDSLLFNAPILYFFAKMYF